MRVKEVVEASVLAWEEGCGVVFLVAFGLSEPFGVLNVTCDAFYALFFERLDELDAFVLLVGYFKL